MQKYNRAKRVVPIHGTRTRSPVRLRLKRSTSYRKPSNGDLVYLDNSPNYCDENSRLGHLGTRHRKCERNTSGKNSCDLLCCGRGVTSHTYTKTTRCHCKFQWCCEVRCKVCTEKVEVNTCKWFAIVLSRDLCSHLFFWVTNENSSQHVTHQFPGLYRLSRVCFRLLPISAVLLIHLPPSQWCFMMKTNLWNTLIYTLNCDCNL